MTKVYLLIETTCTDGGYDYLENTIGVFSSKLLAEYKKPQNIIRDGYSQEYRVVEMELQTANTLIEKLKYDLENLECTHKGEKYQDESSDGILHTFCADCHNVVEGCTE